MVYFSTERGWAGILMILLMAVSNDTFGYIAGVIWGKHPIAPTISPKKSWEGFAGSYLGSAVVACIALSILGQKWYWGIPLAAVMVIASTAGDLVESVFKRPNRHQGYCQISSWARRHDGSSGLGTFCGRGWVFDFYLCASSLERNTG